MKFSLYFILVALSAVVSKSHALVPGLLDQGREMVSLLEEARKCQLEKTGEGLKFCTGIVLTSHDLNFLKGLDLGSCKTFLKQMKYDVAEVKLGQKVKGVPKEDLEHFFTTSKLAYILHQEKIILFKREAKRGDCLHEIIHFYQRHRPRQDALAPLKRKEKERRLQFLLEKSVERVEFYEKKGEVKKAKEMASELQPFIQLQKEWQNMIHWLDEKEVYQLFFDYGALVGTGERDYDVSLSNLVRLKESLPWSLEERVLHAANIELNKKYAKVKIPAKKEGNEAQLNELYHQGKLGRDEFEKKVIGLRKYEAKKDMEKAKSLLEQLQAQLRLRDFQSASKEEVNLSAEISFKKERDLWQVDINGLSFLIDTGAQVSVLSPKLLKGLKRKDVELYGAKNLQTAYGKNLQAPLIKVKKKIQIGGAQIPFIVGAVGDLGLPGFDGIIGMDFFQSFNKGQWVIDLKKLVLKKGKIKGDLNFYLEPNGLGEIDSLEFYCSEKKEVKLRLDSGSQYLGERKKNPRKEKKISCVDKSVVKEMTTESPNSVLFSREVEVNLGTPYLHKFSHLGLDMNQKSISLKRL